MNAHIRPIIHVKLLVYQSQTGMRIDAIAMKPAERAKHQCVEVVSDSTTAVVTGLCERTEYLITVTAVTEEYFDQLPPGHDQRRARQLPKSRAPPEDVWLPSTSIVGSTSGKYTWNFPCISFTK